MSHVRTQLRAALATALAGLPSAPTVFINRLAPISATQAPCLRITTPQESIDSLGVTMDLQDRSVTVLVEGYVKGDALDDAADQVGLEVEQAVAAADTLGGLLQAPMRLSEVRMEIDDLSSPPLGMVRMAYTAQIYTLAATPDTAI